MHRDVVLLLSPRLTISTPLFSIETQRGPGVDLVPAPLHGPPQSDSDRKHQIVVLASARLIRRPSRSSEVSAELLQLLG
jgi:hypothetical protein